MLTCMRSFLVLIYTGLFLIHGALAQDCRWETGFEARGFDDNVRVLAGFDDGNGETLYAAGDFTAINNRIVNYIAKWDGTQWISLDSGISGQRNATYIDTLHVHNDGLGPALYVGGRFQEAGGHSTLNIAKWTGQEWQPLGPGFDGLVRKNHQS